MAMFFRLMRWLRKRGSCFIGYALVVTQDAELKCLLSNMLMDVELYPYCFPDVDAVKEIVRRAIPIRLLILDLQAASREEVKILCKARFNRLVPFVLLSSQEESSWILNAGIEERCVYFVPKPIDVKRLRETILIARLQTT